ncbi:argininosuccinate lyase [Victivallis sp. Marseille-Q1083]|uniref:argininosuccinate lyase n=1 Tax=Victivallis sp. Marseille-Q1083 TaxID=2717288 RepID=UPI00158C9F4A|nr:argininosuccinate lyase [Victivallis sp. Marseille-Q1083]
MALWGGRFEAETNEYLKQFSESISYDKRLYAWDIAGSKAHVTMLGAQRIIPEATARTIIAELDAIKARIDRGEFEFKIELEDIHMHIESALIDKLGAEGARVHSARSRNDQVALDIRLYLRDEIGQLIRLLRAFQRALLEQAEANAEVIMPGFTHLQHAQVVLFAHHLLAYVEMFSRDAERLEECRRRVNVMPLGSGALAGSTLPIDREMVCRLLNFDRVTRNSMDAVADRDFAIELVADLAMFAMHVSRLSEDLILWCSQEFAFVELGDAFCTGSSLMPQKKNPDVAELSRGKTARVYGALTALLTLCKGLPLTYNRDLQEDKEQIFDALDTVKMILKIYPPMIASMKPNAGRMAAAAADPALMATDLAEKLVELGVPFRTAHHRVGALVKYCREQGRALDGLELAEMRSVIPEATAECTRLFDPRGSVAKREIVGGTGFQAVKAQIDFWKKQLAAEVGSCPAN